MNLLSHQQSILNTAGRVTLLTISHSHSFHLSPPLIFVLLRGEAKVLALIYKALYYLPPLHLPYPLPLLTLWWLPVSLLQAYWPQPCFLEWTRHWLSRHHIKCSLYYHSSRMARLCASFSSFLNWICLVRPSLVILFKSHNPSRTPYTFSLYCALSLAPFTM